MRSAELGARLRPERRHRNRQFNDRPDDHDVVEAIPRHIPLRDHRRRNERTQRSAQPVEAVQEAENLVGGGHVADPGVPGGIF